jgi:hypothetical protein
VRKPEKITMLRPGRKMEIIFKSIFKKSVGDVDFIDLAQDRERGGGLF